MILHLIEGVQKGSAPTFGADSLLVEEQSEILALLLPTVENCREPRPPSRSKSSRRRKGGGLSSSSFQVPSVGSDASELLALRSQGFLAGTSINVPSAS